MKFLFFLSYSLQKNYHMPATMWITHRTAIWELQKHIPWDFPKVTQLGSGRARTWAQLYLIPRLCCLWLFTFGWISFQSFFYAPGQKQSHVNIHGFSSFPDLVLRSLCKEGRERGTDLNKEWSNLPSHGGKAAMERWEGSELAAFGWSGMWKKEKGRKKRFGELLW